MHLYEDLVAVGRSEKLLTALNQRSRVLNSGNRRVGVKARRGDGTFGELVPGENPIVDPDYAVARGRIATVEIGTEVKILAKAMIKQIDRVINDLRNQVTEFRRGGGNPISVAVVGINHAKYCVGYEGARAFKTTGRSGYAHPYQEAEEAERRLRTEAQPLFDEFVVLRYIATNESPYPFEWKNHDDTRLDYSAALTRISSRYQQRF